MKGPLGRSAQEWWSGLSIEKGKPSEPLSVALTASGEFVGQCGFLESLGNKSEWEIYCLFRRKHWGAGFATEVSRALVFTAFNTLGAQRVIGIVNPANTVSIRLVERIGFRRVSTYVKKGSWQDGHLLFAIDRVAYNNAFENGREQARLRALARAVQRER